MLKVEEMKVCKVVINSVSNDPRVLKEAEAVREAGFDVTIIGIQDANNEVPCEQLENSILIRRASWRGRAFRPITWLYVCKCLLAFSLAACIVAVLAEGLRMLPTLFLRGIGWNFSWLQVSVALLATVAGFATLYYARLQFSEYRRRRKSFLSIRKSEDDNLLKYDVLLERRKAEERRKIRSDAGRERADSVDEDVKPSEPRETGKRRRPSRKLSDYLPRPLMGGLRRAVAPKEVARWKVVFAREACIYSILKEEKPDIVHAHDLSALPVAVKYSRRFGTKLVFDAHEIYDHLAQADDEMADLNGKLLSKYSPMVDHFITINDSIARYYRNNYKAFPPAVVIKNATKLAPEIEYDGRLHDAAVLPRDRKILIYQGGFAPKRGLVQLLLSAEYLNPDWTLVFMGWGKLRDELLGITDSLVLRDPAIEDKIRFVPKVKQTELPLWTAGASLGAIPYENTGLNHWFCNPNKLWEYPNAAVPIIASPFPELRALIEKYNLGWFLPESLSPREIAATINELTDEQLAEASVNCRRFIAQDNWSVYAKRLHYMYGGLR